jgi:hypothetical protein
MKKIYSIVLMAAALLVSTNIWATVHEVANVAAFKNAWNAAQSGDVIKLTDDITSNGGLDATLWLGTANQNDAAKSIEIDLAGHDLESKAAYAFVISHGELKITTSVVSEGHNKLTHTGNSETFYVTGSTKKDVDPSVDGSNYFTHLVIGANVTVERPQLTTTKTKPTDPTASGYANDYASYVSDKYRNYKCAVISIDHIWKSSSNAARAQGVQYLTNVYAEKASSSNKGIANGVRVDIYGTINGLRYGIKPNGLLGNVNYFITNSARKPGASLPTGLMFNDDAIDTNYQIEDGDDGYSPFIHIYPGAKVTALRETPEELVADMKPSSGKTSRAKWGTPTALYGGGYARWIIEGEAEGASGAIIKSGNVAINDATITGTGTYVEATSTGSSNTGEGSGLLVVSDNAWAGDVQVTVSGTSEVSSENGYAVEETVPAGDTKVENVQINGGTFTGGTEGAISISETTATSATATVLVTSATIEGDVNYGDNGELSDIIPNGKEDIVIKEDPNTGVKTVVVTVVDTPTPIATTFDIDDAEDGNSYDLSNLEDDNRYQYFDRDANKTMTIGSLKINPTNIDETFDNQQMVKLTITAGHTIIADKVILGDKAQIIVEPGAFLIVKGTEGIVSTKADNIILQANATDQATFLLNPAVVNNSEPNATVEMYTECLQTSANPYYYKFQEFALPVKEGVKPANNYDGETLYPGQSQFSTSVRAYNYEQHKFDYLSSWSQLKPFTNYQMTNNTKDGDIIYTFEGKLLGNKNRSCQFVDAEGFGYFGNSHLAPISVAKLMEDFSADVEKTVWVYDYAAHKYAWVNEDSYVFGGAAFEEIKSMQAFVLYLNEGETTTAPINYAKAIWGNPRFASMTSAAPARNRVNTMNNGALIKVVAANGMADNVIVMEKDSYTENFDNGSDASKLMNQDGIDLYATTAIGNLSCVADNSIENTRLTFKAGEATEYMLQLGKVFGEDYAIRDNMTGTIINCAEGVAYNFTQAENTVAEGRFEIIAVAKIATGMENTEIKANVKGVYSITGMYLGEDINVLPAGVYVVNGTKVVK